MKKEKLLNLLYLLPILVILFFSNKDDNLLQAIHAMMLVVTVMILIFTVISKQLIRSNILKLIGLSTLFIAVYSSWILLFNYSDDSLFTLNDKLFYMSVLFMSGSLLYGMIYIKNSKELNTPNVFIINTVMIGILFYIFSKLGILNTLNSNSVSVYKIVFILLIVIINIVNIILLYRNKDIDSKLIKNIAGMNLLLVFAVILSYFTFERAFVISNFVVFTSMVYLLTVIINDGLLIPYKEKSELLITKSSELENLIRVDKLTNLPNRKEIYDMYNRVLRFSKREKQTVVVIMIDIDDFTFYNDKFGTIHGDSILVRIANALKKECKRPLDIVGRAGGDEFLAVLPNSDFEGGRVVTKRIQKAIRNLRIVHHRRENEFLSCSIGYISISPDQNTEGDYPMHQAQKQMNKIKNTGKNSILGIDLDKGENI